MAGRAEGISEYHFTKGDTFIVDEMTEGDRGYARGPERALLSALLFDGIQAFMSFVCGRGSSTSKRDREAYKWVMDKEKEYVFSFNSVCEALGIDPNFLRYGLVNACNSVSEDWKRGRRNF